MKNKKTVVEFIKFGIVGFINTVLSYIIYIVLVKYKINYLVAHIISFAITVLIAYFLNMKYVFKSTDNKLKSLIKVYISYGITFLLSTSLLYIQVHYLNISEYIAPIFNLFITTPANFLLNKYWSFKKGGKNEKNKK